LLISEFAKATGTTTKTLRFYENQGLMPPTPRAANGYRDYDANSATRLNFITRARAAGLSIAQIRSILAINAPGKVTCSHVRDVLATQLAELDHKIQELSTLRTAVATSLAAVASGDPAECDSSKVCSYL
jgi:DNA-binding transcriptional MerR regulator